ncbi:MAG: tetraprenyl-beta-curcumene synthase family protein [Clostridia bacterium]|nr:tetraprenyl-beta-curcumene synthase family protein [Clostridia bacterium]
MKIEVRYESGIKLVLKYIKDVFPEVDREIDHWINMCASSDNDLILSSQAQASILHKKFHAQGGCIYSLYPNTDLKKAVKFIVSLQTISDYLDNLCDRAGVYDESAFLQLHLSMLDAVDPDREPSDYYKYYPYKHDNNYLASLVKSCRAQLSELPSYGTVRDSVIRYIRQYSEMQSYKHISKDKREDRLKEWASQYIDTYTDISCWEFSAAAGSTLGVFVLYAVASDPLLTADAVQMINEVYFPWICGLHILLDYYIDSHEDIKTGDLNFTYYYENLKQCEERISFFIDRSLDGCRYLPYPEFHITVVKGLLSMYLSDPKASTGLNKLTSRRLLKKGEENTKFYYALCKILRTFKKL